MSSAFFNNKSESPNKNLYPYTPSAFAKTNLIHLQEIGSLQALEPHTSKREHLSSYLFLLVLSGAGTLEYCGKIYSLNEGDCVFLDCHKPYSHYTSDDLWKLIWIHFHGPNMNNIYNKYIDRGGRVCFHSENQSLYIQLMEELNEIVFSKDYIQDMKIYEKLVSLLTMLMEESWHPEDKRHTSINKQNLLNVKKYLDQNYTQKINLDNLADIFYINKFYLARTFKEQFGTSINNYLIELRITRAKQLLRLTDHSIETIAMECGIHDANYFSRIFKKVEGTSPGAFRRNWQTNQ